MICAGKIAPWTSPYILDGQLSPGLLRFNLSQMIRRQYLKYIPYPVTVGFTAGIAVVIFASQLAALLGLTLTGAEPGAFIPKLEALAAALPSVNPAAVAVAVLAIGVIVAIRHVRPHWPA